jgi:protein-S-isoprenylcysteine O-methyltransferase Ste14
MLPGRQRRTLGLERMLVRLVATGGVVGVGVALGAILRSSNVQGWIIGLVVALVSVILSAILWSSRQL